MPNKPLTQAREIQAIIFVLEGELERLDHLGAGIAAIHVNAAIEQLRTNLSIVNDNSLSQFDPSLLCQVDSRSGAADRRRNRG